MLFYADHIAQYADTVGRLQCQLIILSQFCKRTGMEVNLEKANIIVFRNRSIIKQNEKFYFNGQLIKSVPYYKYLGLFFSSRLNWSYGTQNLCIQSHKAINMLKRLIGKCHGLPLDIVFKIFTSNVLPILTYGGEVWGCSVVHEIEKVQLRFCKYLLVLRFKPPM